MTETPFHTDASVQSPFQEEIVLENYYASENSQHVLSTIRQAIADGVRLLVLSGDEGSGKTMLCHKLDRDPQDVFTTIFFPRTVDSFEDVVRIVALGLGLDQQLTEKGRSVDVLLDEISEAIIQGGVPVLLIFDEAENIYLATLERIRKMLDRLSADGGWIHILFAGRKTFVENCQQLSMCDFQNAEEYYIALEPLSEEETGAYLHHCSSKLANIDGANIYTAEVVKNIYQISGGNFRMTNILAEEALQKDGDDTSFMVLLENVKEDVGEQSSDFDFIQLIRDYVGQYRTYMIYAGAAVGAVLLTLVFLFSSKKPDMNEEPLAVITQEEEKPAIIKTEPDNRVDDSTPPSIKEPHQESAQESPSSLPNTNKDIVIVSAVKEPEQLPEIEIDVEEQIEFSEPLREGDVLSTEVEKREEVSKPKRDAVPKIAAEPKRAADPKVVVESKVVVEQALVPSEKKEQDEAVILLRDASIKKRPGKLPKTTQVTIKEQIKKEISRNEVKEVIDSNAHFTVEQLYKKRLMAGSSWYNKEKNDRYTVQLMVLTSKTAEENLKNMLHEDRYRQEAGNFYIFKKLSTSDTLFVFYGEYSTIAQARLAQNSLPQFLRDHKPYAISVKGAMAKVRR